MILGQSYMHNHTQKYSDLHTFTHTGTNTLLYQNQHDRLFSDLSIKPIHNFGRLEFLEEAIFSSSYVTEPESPQAVWQTNIYFTIFPIRSTSMYLAETLFKGELTDENILLNKN